MTGRLLSPRRIAGVAVVAALLAAGAVAAGLTGSPAAPGVTGRPGPAAKHRRPQVVQQGPRALAGLRLMTEAAAACRSVAYYGVQVAVWWGRGGATASVVQVWHRPGSAALAQAAATESGSAASGAGMSQDAAGIIGVSQRQLTLMRANYVISYSGPGTADDRPAQVVEAWRADGSLAARFWLDSGTKLPLRRELFDSRARMISEDAFISLHVGENQLAGMPPATASSWAGELHQGRLTALRSAGWPVPRALPGGLSLVAASQAPTRSGPVIDLSYSDGLSVISLFLQRGELPRNLAGWRPVEMQGRDVYASGSGDQSIAWSAHGFVYTMIADAPDATVDAVVDRLPHDPDTDFWGRMERGFRRLASWANPFG